MEQGLLRSSAALERAREAHSRTGPWSSGGLHVSSQRVHFRLLYCKHQKVLFAQDPEFSSELDFSGARGSAISLQSAPIRCRHGPRRRA